MLVFFFPFFENLGSYVYDSMRARTVLFLKGTSTAIFSLRSCTACARVLSLCMLAPARAGPPATTAPALSATRRQRRKVDKCRVADKKQTNRQTNKQTLLFYRYRYKEHTTIKDIEIAAILNARQTLMFTKGKTWSKRNASNCFNVAMGSYDGAEICELVGLFVLDQLKKILPRQNIGLYRDDGLAVIESTSGPKADKTRKDIIEIFKTIGLQITIEANLKAVNFLDTTLNLDTGLYQRYRKPNDQTRYVHAQSNHPPAITKNLPRSIEQRLSKISSNKEVFEKAAPYYQQAPQNSGYTQHIEYQEERPKRKRNRNRTITWFNPPFSKTSKRTSPGDFSKCSTNISRKSRNSTRFLTNQQ